MEREFWLDKWAQDDIGFHRQEVNALLKQHWAELCVPAERGVLVPLCGKSLDMRWLEALGHQVWGVELAEKAVRAYFEEGGETAEERPGLIIRSFSGPGTTIYCGSFLDLAAPDIRGTAGVYDRGALVALPARQRAHYADHLQRVVPELTVMLLIMLEYDQERIEGPPFSVAEEEVQRLYAERCSVAKLSEHAATELPPKFAKAGVTAARECAYRIVKER